MKKTHLLKLTIILGVLVMLISFAIVPDDYPWYFEILLFNIGLWPWLLARNVLKKMNSKNNPKTYSNERNDWYKILGTVMMLMGAISVFIKNDSSLHTALQIVFIIGCIIFLFGARFKKSIKNSTTIFILMISITISAQLTAQDYDQQLKAFEQSFHQQDISIIKPYLSDSLKIGQMPTQNTIPILTNIVTKLPTLNKIKLLQTKKGRVQVEYDFEQLGISESYVHFDKYGKMKKIEFVNNLVRQQIEQQQKMQSSVQVPKPDKIPFDYSKRKIEFPSKDGLIISADLYEIDLNKPTILLCHQAGYNKYEYADIAPRLNKIGFNVLSIDQRSGGTFADKPNETYNRAVQNGIEKIDFTDAVQDIESAISFLTEKYKQKVIVWGSSYSSSLALHIAAKNKNVKAVISFSPGDYFGTKYPSLKIILPKIEQPFLLTSSKDEADELKVLMEEVDQYNLQLQFIPKSDGFHGSRALWIDQQGADEYWTAITSFLSDISQK